MDEDQAARMEHLTEEFWHPDNFLFFTGRYPTWCALCSYYLRESEIFSSFEELVYHLDCVHIDEDHETDSLKSNLLILDEPTDGFSKTQLSKVRDVLQELKSQQIILVSHEKELETYVDNIFKISKDAGMSQITRLSN